MNVFAATSLKQLRVLHFEMRQEHGSLRGVIELLQGGKMIAKFNRSGVALQQP